MAFEAFFLPAVHDGGRAGQRFCILNAARSAVPFRGGLVYIHPFAEEMNKARRMAAAQSRALAQAGHAVLRIDLFGCGDSSGDFGDASWEHWIDDALLACDWLRRETGTAPWLWGLRAGCLVAAGAARRTDAAGLLFWQPVVSGKQHLQQFLRLKNATRILSGERMGSEDRPKADPRRGDPVEVAGYTLSPGLARGLENAELVLPERPTRVEWLEITASEEKGLSPAAAARLEEWRARGHAVRGVAAPGPSFWQTVEIAECPALIAATLAAIVS
jgi:exosortase A-associated hydrolase 2